MLIEVVPFPFSEILTGILSIVLTDLTLIFLTIVI